MNIKPLGKNVVLEKYQVEETTSSGIVLPESSKDEDRARIVALGHKLEGKDKYNELFSVGDTVVYKSFSGTTVELNDTEYIIVDIDDVLAVIEE